MVSAGSTAALLRVVAGTVSNRLLETPSNSVETRLAALLAGRNPSENFNLMNVRIAPFSAEINDGI